MRYLGLAALLLHGGCALMMEANAHHNSRGTSCIDTPEFAMVDIAIGGIAAAGVAVSEESPGYYAIPGVFLASGIVGVVSAIRCKGDDERAIAEAPPASNSAPSFGEAPVDPEARPATAEEWGYSNPPEPHTPQHPLLKVRLDENVGVNAPVEKQSCRDAPSSCPQGQICAIAGDDAGYCVPAP